jgi:hypothetical protein
MHPDAKAHASALLSVLAFVSAFSAVLSLPCGGAAALQDGDYTYTIGGSPAVATITAYTGAGGPVVIPSTLGGYPTAAIGSSAFDSQAGHAISSVVIPESVSAIGIGAFAACSSLTTANVPDSVTVIEAFTFSDCSSLATVRIGSGVESIVTYAFAQCSSLASVEIPDSVTSIGYGAFISCTSLTSVSIGSGVASIGVYSFFDCVNLTSLSIGGSVTSIGINAFAGCASLPSVTVPEGVASIGAGGFAQCSSLLRMQFDGDAPSCGIMWAAEHNPGLVVYYRSGASGFTDTWYGIPTVMMTAPSAPRAVSAAAGDSQASLSWSAPSSDGGDPLAGYALYYGTGEIPARVYGNYSVSTHAAVITGLAPGARYVFGVKAFNGIGDSDMSELANATPYSRPGAPISVSAAAGPGNVTVTWQAPTSDGGSAITGYRVYRTLAGGHEPIAVLGPGTFACVDWNVTGGGTYTYCVAATNAAGEGADSAQASATVQNADGNDAVLYICLGLAALAVIVILFIVLKGRG